MMEDTDTIFALSSGAGRAGVAVFRLSGPSVQKTLQALCSKAPKKRQASLRKLRDPINKKLIDEALVFWFQGPASFTGEDIAELHIHGSLAVINKLTDCLIKLNLRPAEPGEFTQRAFRNGRLDLAQTEALADLIDAETDKQRQQALGQFSGNLSQIADQWRHLLINCLAPLEAAIDFPDEADIPADIERRAKPVISEMIQALQNFLEKSTKAQRIRKGVSIAVIGPPNAGKSSLLNWLAGSDVAIVSDIAGTTRDLIETRIELAAIPVTLIDTAGLRKETDDPIEQEGIKRATQKAKEVDLRIGIIAQNDQQALPEIKKLLSDQDILLINKSDLGSPDIPEIRTINLFISLKDTTGLAHFLEHLETKIIELCGAAEEPALTRARHVHAVNTAHNALTRALNMLNIAPELAAEDIRSAIQSLGQITGAVDVEDVLGEIFSTFCVGK